MVDSEASCHGATVVLITGLPGSGKSTLGIELAGALRVPFLARDDVRGGLFFSEGSWTGHPRRVPQSEQAVEALLRTVETMARLGVSCVVEYVIRRDRAHDIERLTAVAHCVVLITESSDAHERVVRRNLADRLLNREEVLDLLGYASIEEHTSDAVRRMEQVGEEMQIEFDLPTLRIDTDHDLEPRLETIIEFIATSTWTRL